jgi:hypothetical protein
VLLPRNQVISMLKCGFLNKGRGITREQAVPVTYPQPPDNKEAKKKATGTKSLELGKILSYDCCFRLKSLKLVVEPCIVTQ